MSASLTLRPRKTYLYVLQALFGFCNFQATSCFVQKLRTYSFDSTRNLLGSLCAYTLEFVFPGLLRSACNYWYYLFQGNYYCYCCCCRCCYCQWWGEFGFGPWSGDTGCGPGPWVRVGVEGVELVCAGSGHSLVVGLLAVAGGCRLGAVGQSRTLS